MTSRRDQGLASSIALYLAVLTGALTLFAMPVYWLNAGTKFENPGLAAYNAPPGASLVRKQDPNALQLAILQHDTIIDATQLAAINARAPKAGKTPRPAVHTVQRERSEPDERYAARPPSRGFFFGLF